MLEINMFKKAILDYMDETKYISLDETTFILDWEDLIEFIEKY